MKVLYPKYKIGKYKIEIYTFRWKCFRLMMWIHYFMMIVNFLLTNIWFDTENQYFVLTSIRSKPLNYLMKVVSFIITYLPFETENAVADRKVNTAFCIDSTCIWGNQVWTWKYHSFVLNLAQHLNLKCYQTNEL